MTQRWFPLAITQDDLFGGFTITLTSDVPCHLFLHWTSKVPWVHRTSTIERGLAVPWDAYWCYVVWQIIEQQEPGDTTTHTFSWLGWQICQTKYFRFAGTITGESSPSDSPIFRKHYSYVPPPEEKKDYNEDWTTRRDCWENIWIAQTFTTTQGYTCTKCQLHSDLNQGTYPEQEYAICDLRTVDGAGHPTAIILATCEVPLPPAPGTGDIWNDFEWEASAHLSAATKYAILLRKKIYKSTDPQLGYAYWSYSALNPYPAGNYTFSNDYGAHWYPNLLRDFAFRTYGIPD